jgi:transposase
MKLSPSSVKRVWMHWTKTKMPLKIKKFGRKKKTLDEESVKLILEVHKEQNLGGRRVERIIEFTHGTHIPHNAIHKELLSHGLTNLNRNKSKRRKTLDQIRTQAQPVHGASGLAYQHSRWEKGVHLRGPR